ncbi:MFS transporter [Iodidimonas nitroreducens]|uniref:MFS transporter n=1 Tax=Iodidimonas nitroreducens TaxID=1236968 RepID=A0A5A7N2X6_9PROT|nr:transcription antitermination factor NusB [Iodidimonas nitroreducens]GAK34891.1 ribosomal RNA small subunit methyltransferase B [alpha proteobacterium Q-1]GER02367.1 MFS transporter [Iodidimonas nitroreducens]
MQDSLAPRRLALAILDHVLNRRQTLDLAVDAALKTWPMGGLDRAFARMIATRTLRYLGFIDHLLDDFLTEGVPEKCRYADLVLRAGLAQLLFMDVADHAAVDCSVALIGGSKHRADRGMKPVVNALLRRVARERPDILARLEADPALVLPPWLAYRWRQAYGDAALAAMARILVAEPPLDLSLRNPADGPALCAEWGDAGHAATPIALMADEDAQSFASIRLAQSTDVTGLPGFDAGRFWVQDVAASLPARLLPPGPAIDLCAAPGGKTLQLAARAAAGAKPADLLAIDRSARRLGLLRQNLARTGLAAEIAVADATSFIPDHPPAAVLLDAPCSSTGTLRRHPDIGWLKGPADIHKLVDLQKRILDHVASILAPDGVILYCVCSLEPEEGEDQARDFLTRHGDFRRLPIRAEDLPGLSQAINDAGEVRTRPDHWGARGGMDGFFIARLQKTGP